MYSLRDRTSFTPTVPEMSSQRLRLAALPGVHALTDVTGFGLLGHVLEVCKGSGVRATLRLDAVPLLADARQLAAAGHVTGGSSRNWKAYGSLVALNGHGEIDRARAMQLARMVLHDNAAKLYGLK